jgi:hypothetical protein
MGSTGDYYLGRRYNDMDTKEEVTKIIENIFYAQKGCKRLFGLPFVELQIALDRVNEEYVNLKKIQE